MSLSTVTLVAPPRVVVPSAVERPERVPDDGPRVAQDAVGATPFARPQADNVGGWVAGLLFGVLCILAAFALLASIAVVALAVLVRRGIATLADGGPRAARLRRPVLA